MRRCVCVCVCVCVSVCVHVYVYNGLTGARAHAGGAGSCNLLGNRLFKISKKKNLKFSDIEKKKLKKITLYV